jgi:hypothetical protein
MASTAFQTQYRQEYVAQFEQKQSFFRVSATTESAIKGNQAVFLVAGTGGATAVTRGVNGLIPGRNDSLTQNTATLTEWHDKPKRTSFNIFASQGDGRRILQEGSVKVLNRKIDDTIITQLSTGTQTTSTAAGVQASLALFTKALGILGNADVDVDEEENMFCAVSHAAWNYMMQIKEFANSQYVDVRPMGAGPILKARNWIGVNFFKSNRLSGRTTSNCLCLMWHRAAIGYAVNTGEMQVMADYNSEEDYYWARASMNMGAVLMQNTGVVVINHDDSAVVSG